MKKIFIVLVNIFIVFICFLLFLSTPYKPYDYKCFDKDGILIIRGLSILYFFMLFFSFLLNKNKSKKYIVFIVLTCLFIVYKLLSTFIFI